jgi:hypothetical protein
MQAFQSQNCPQISKEGQRIENFVTDRSTAAKQKIVKRFLLYFVIVLKGTFENRKEEKNRKARLRVLPIPISHQGTEFYGISGS